MTQIELAVFDFVDDFLAEKTAGKDDKVTAESTLVIFLENLFDQFFASIGFPISGTGRKAKAEAATLAEKLSSEADKSQPTRAVIADFEEFCDLRTDLGGRL